MRGRADVRALRLGALTARHLHTSNDELEALVGREDRVLRSAPSTTTRSRQRAAARWAARLTLEHHYSSSVAAAQHLHAKR